MVLPVVLYGFETWSLTLKDEHRPRMFGNKMLRKVFRPKRSERNCIMRGFMICTLHDVLGRSSKNEVGGACATYWREEKCMQGFGRLT